MLGMEGTILFTEEETKFLLAILDECEALSESDSCLVEEIHNKLVFSLEE